MEMVISMSNKTIDVTRLVALPLNVIIQESRIVVKSLNAEVFDPSRPCRQFDQMQDFERGKICAEGKHIFVTLKLMVS